MNTKTKKELVDMLLPIAEIREGCIISLRNDLRWRWPVGTKLYAIDRAAMAELIEAVKEELDANKRYGIGGAATDRLSAAFARISGGS